MVVTRFAPSPTGRLHLGHAYSALFAWNIAQQNGGQFLLRIEDIDQNRSKSEFIEGIYEDLEWLKLSWPTPVRYQSENHSDYAAAVGVLNKGNFLYPCFCTRKEIQREIAASGNAPHGSDGLIYSGICRELNITERCSLLSTGRPYALRLNAEKAIGSIGSLVFNDRRLGTIEVDPRLVGDVVIARKDVATSYHLSVTVDDALQGVTIVTRGEDLLPATHIHTLLQVLLGLPQPEYHHHQLLKDEDGNRLAKRHGASTLKLFRENGGLPEEVYEFAAFKSSERTG